MLGEFFRHTGAFDSPQLPRMVRADADLYFRQNDLFTASVPTVSCFTLDSKINNKFKEVLEFTRLQHSTYDDTTPRDQSRKLYLYGG